MIADVLSNDGVLYLCMGKQYQPVISRFLSGLMILRSSIVAYYDKKQQFVFSTWTKKHNGFMVTSIDGMDFDDCVNTVLLHAKRGTRVFDPCCGRLLLLESMIVKGASNVLGTELSAEKLARGLLNMRSRGLSVNKESVDE